MPSPLPSEIDDRRGRVCVIGAGSSGLAALRHLREQGIDCDCLERDADVGGIWQFDKPTGGIYASTRLISSKRLTEFPDFRMPREWPQYPGHREVFQYFQDYAREFGLYEAIEFGTEVARADRGTDCWRVELADGTRRAYGALVVANGHNWQPSLPQFPGEFHGTLLHSRDYKTPDILSGRRVLVIGAGNSGCDIAVESAQHAAATWHSTRRGYHYLPKFLFGSPTDACGERLLRWRLPLWLRRGITSLAVRAALGRPEQVGLPRPDHRLFESHPIINSQLYYYLGHGQIRPKPDVAALRGGEVEFADGTREPIDVIVCATGYEISFPFLDRRELNWHDARPELFLNVFHPQRDDLFVIGLIQPDSGQWGLAHYQARLVARFLAAMRDERPAAQRAAARFRRLKSSGGVDLSGGIRYLSSRRHLLEVEHFGYRRRLQKLIRGFDR